MGGKLNEIFVVYFHVWLENRGDRMSGKPLRIPGRHLILVTDGEIQSICSAFPRVDVVIQCLMRVQGQCFVCFLLEFLSPLMSTKKLGNGTLPFNGLRSHFCLTTNFWKGPFYAGHHTGIDFSRSNLPDKSCFKLSKHASSEYSN